MSTAAVTNTFVNAAASSASAVNTNFSDLVTFLNNSVVHRDGSKAMTAAFDAGTNKITNVAAATAASDATILSQAASVDVDGTGSGAVILTTGTVVGTVSVTMPSAGFGLLLLAGTYTTSGVTYGGGTVQVTLAYSVSGFSTLSATAMTMTSNSTANVPAVGKVVALAAGVNTITVTATRVNTTASGGTCTFDSGFKMGLIGMA